MITNRDINKLVKDEEGRHYLLAHFIGVGLVRAYPVELVIQPRCGEAVDMRASLLEVVNGEVTVTAKVGDL
jgi:hypothetical protein